MCEKLMAPNTLNEVFEALLVAPACMGAAPILVFIVKNARKNRISEHA
jgi:hypothetical protein